MSSTVLRLIHIASRFRQQLLLTLPVCTWFRDVMYKAAAISTPFPFYSLRSESLRNKCVRLQLCIFWGTILTIIVPVICMGLDVWIWMVGGGGIHKEGRLKGWALKSRLFWVLKWQRAQWAPFGPKKVEVSASTPSKAPINGFPAIQSRTSRGQPHIKKQVL